MLGTLRALRRPDHQRQAAVWAHPRQGPLVRRVFSLLHPAPPMTERCRSHEAQVEDAIFCPVQVERTLPSCGHRVTLACSADVNDVTCRETCDEELPCCSARCTARCSTCRKLSTAAAKPQKSANTAPLPLASQPQPAFVPRTTHGAHPCDKPLPSCAHRCSERCEVDHACGPCQQPRFKTCGHGKLPVKCSEPVQPCESRA